jgi:hypothetical protein
MRFYNGLLEGWREFRKRGPRESAAAECSPRGQGMPAPKRRLPDLLDSTVRYQTAPSNNLHHHPHRLCSKEAPREGNSPLTLVPLESAVGQTTSSKIS